MINRQIDLVCNGLARSKSRIERVIPREGETTLGTVKVRVWSVSWKLPSRLGSFFFKPCSVLPTLDKLSQRRDCCRYTKTLASNRRQTETETLISKYVQTRRIFLRSTHARFRHVRKIVKRIGIGVDRTFAREREKIQNNWKSHWRFHSVGWRKNGFLRRKNNLIERKSQGCLVACLRIRARPRLPLAQGCLLGFGRKGPKI